jgi:hypothetical protein
VVLILILRLLENQSLAISPRGPMRRSLISIHALLSVVLATCLPGCLSLGGKTVYTNESPETNERLTALESRIGVLEQAVGNRQAAPSPPALR